MSVVVWNLKPHQWIFCTVTWKFSGLFVLRMVLLPTNDFCCILSSFGKYWFPEVCRLPNVVISLWSILKSHLLLFFCNLFSSYSFFYSILTFFFFFFWALPCGMWDLISSPTRDQTKFRFSYFKAYVSTVLQFFRYMKQGERVI